MSRIEDEILRQLHLCAALMSDPLILLEQSGVVADQFTSAMHKIETLQAYLHPPKDPCARHNWLDSSVLTKGVKGMVSSVLAKHMEPLRWMTPKQLREAEARNEFNVKTKRNSAPLIFERKFKTDGRKHPIEETLVSREIKETNCMASLVLLHYYLHWHVLLITLNYKIHPCVEGHEQGMDHILDIDRLLKGLPGFCDTFELRPIRSWFRDRRNDGDNGTDDAASDGDDDQNETAENLPGVDGGANATVRDKRASIDAEIKRFNAKVLTLINDGMYDGYIMSVPDMKSTALCVTREVHLMETFRAVLGMTSHPVINSLNDLAATSAVTFFKPDTDSEAPHDRLRMDGKFREAYLMLTHRQILKERLYSSCVEPILNGHVYSVYNLQDDTQRWFDLYTPCEIRTAARMHDEVAEEYGMKATQEKCKPVLVDVLDSWPYGFNQKGVFETAADVMMAERLCIHDFSSASLMMDVSGSFLKLYDLICELRKGKTEDDVLQKKLCVFILQTFVSDHQIGKVLKAMTEAFSPIHSQTDVVKNNWVSIPLGNYKRNSEFSDHMFEEYTLDEIAGHYWGSRLSSTSNLNHRYFTWPVAEQGGYKNISRLVQLMLNTNTLDAAAHKRFIWLMNTGLRNSLFLQPVLESQLLLIEKLNCVSFFDGSPVKLKPDDLIYLSSGDDPNKDVDITAVSGRNASDKGDAAKGTQLKNNLKPNAAFTIRKNTLISSIRTELDALHIRVDRANKGEFKLYGGVSWPISHHDDETHNNLDQFGQREKIARVSAGRLVSAIEYIATKIPAQG